MKAEPGQRQTDWKKQLPEVWEPIYEERHVIVTDTPKKCGPSYELSDITIKPAEGQHDTPTAGTWVYNFNGATVTCHFAGLTKAIYERIMFEVQETAARSLLEEYDMGVSTPIALERYELYKYPRFDRKTGRELPPLPRPTRAELRAFHDKLRRSLPMHYRDMVERGILVEITDEELEAERLEAERRRQEET